jgi:nucleoside-diphosphate-sugar epimerase
MNYMDKTVSILGCGWLGLPLAESLISKGYSVKGSTTNSGKLKVLTSKKIKSFLIGLNPDLQGDNVQDFFNSEILIIDIPPGGNEDKITYHKKQVESIIKEVKKSPVQKIIFISSTSVYGNENREVTEADVLNPEKESGKALKIVEEMLFNDETFDKTIIRFAGLIDSDRNPVKFFAGRKNIPGGNISVNLIHRKDCINIIYRIINQNVWNEIFNACSDLHPSKREFYTAAARKFNMPEPEFINTNDGYKIVNSDKLKRRLNYNFIYPDPISMI